MTSRAPIHRTLAELEAALLEIRKSPKEQGPVLWIVRRPRNGEREVVAEAELSREVGLVGDNWATRGGSATGDGSAHPDKQVNVMNSRVISRIARHQDRWKLAGDQLFLDLDLSQENLPAGSRLAIGSAVIEVTAQPHLGCQKFVARFGADALKFVRSPVGRELRLRGLSAKVVRSGAIRVGDLARRSRP